MKDKYINIGTVLLQETCDEILMDMEGNTQSVNQHTEHWLVEDIKKEGFKLYNLDTQRVWLVSRGELNAMLMSNEKYNIKPMLTISDEVA